MTDTKTIEGVRTTGGYADDVRCLNGPHSGNQRFFSSARGYWQCAGCQTAVSTAEVLRRQREAMDKGKDDTMTNEQLARNFLARFRAVTETDVAELTAMLDVAEEDGAGDADWSDFEPTRPGTPDGMRPLIAATERV